MLNRLFDIKLKTSAGRCTLKINKVFEDRGVRVYDAPGFDKKYNLTKDVNLMVRSLGQINAAYILFNSSVTDVEDLIKILLSMKR